MTSNQGGPSLGLLFPLHHFSGQGLPRHYQKLLPPVVSGAIHHHSPNWIMTQPHMSIIHIEASLSAHPSIQEFHPFIQNRSTIRELFPFSTRRASRTPVNICEPGIVVCHWAPSPLAPGKAEASSRHPASCSGVSCGTSLFHPVPVSLVALRTPPRDTQDPSPWLF